MTRHLMRLIWNRKRQNFLLTLEIFFSFIALFGVVLFAMQFAEQLAPAARVTTSTGSGASRSIGRRTTRIRR